LSLPSSVDPAGVQACTRVKIVEPNVLAGPDCKDLVIVMAANARAAGLRKYSAYEDDALKARMGTLRLAQSLPA
jgi:hypothetical protein